MTTISQISMREKLFIHSRFKRHLAEKKYTIVFYGVVCFMECARTADLMPSRFTALTARGQEVRRDRCIHSTLKRYTAPQNAQNFWAGHVALKRYSKKRGT